jgi:hypothetical protein
MSELKHSVTEQSDINSEKGISAHGHHEPALDVIHEVSNPKTITIRTKLLTFEFLRRVMLLVTRSTEKVSI